MYSLHIIFLKRTGSCNRISSLADHSPSLLWGSHGLLNRPSSSLCVRYRYFGILANPVFCHHNITIPLDHRAMTGQTSKRNILRLKSWIRIWLRLITCPIVRMRVIVGSNSNRMTRSRLQPQVTQRSSSAKAVLRPSGLLRRFWPIGLFGPCQCTAVDTFSERGYVPLPTLFMRGYCILMDHSSSLYG